MQCSSYSTSITMPATTTKIAIEIPIQPQVVIPEDPPPLFGAGAGAYYKDTDAEE